MSVADGTRDVSDLTTFATRPSSDRRFDAQRQPRDRFGRWITKGASVQWRDAGRDFAGTIENIENGQAIVSVKNPGSEETTRMTLPPKELRVTSSKATLNFKDLPPLKSQTAEQTINDPSFKSKLESNSKTVVKRSDGYVIEAIKQADVGGNPILYKLYAPSGRSLGEYNDKAIGDFDSMIEEDKKNGPQTENENGDVVPMSPDSLLPGGPIAASAAVVRVARDGTSVIVKEDSVFKVIDVTTGKSFINSTRLDSLVASGGWRRVTEAEKTLSAHLITSEDVEIEITNRAQFRVPTAVKEAITASLNTNPELSDEDERHIASLTTDDLVSIDSINWINKFFAEHEKPENLHGGYAGRKWASKVIQNHEEKTFDNEIEEDYDVYSNFDDDTFVYLGIGHDTSSGTTVSELFSIDLETDAVYKWSDKTFALQETATDEVDAPVIVVLDADTAKTVARWIDIADSTPAMDVLDCNPEERNLFSLAYADLDFEEIDRVTTIIADATGYTPAERSVNAQRQVRGPGGKFGGKQVEQSQVLSVKKATLPQELPLVENIGALIAEWLPTAQDFDSPAEPGTEAPVEEAPVTAAALPLMGEVSEFAELEAEGAPAETPVETAEPAETSTENILYFAIVDPVDRTAVADVVALIKQGGMPVAWLRANASWVKSDEKLSDLQGPTPPPVVKLTVPEPVKSVLAQVDSYDSEKNTAPAETPISASGFTLFDGTFSIYNSDDLTFAVSAAKNLLDTDTEYVIAVKNHIRRRARALNRMDLVPEEWREASLVEIGYAETNTSPLFGEFGEVITASASEFKTFTPKQRENASEKGNALPDGSFPINNVQDLKNAIKAYGRAKESDRAKVRRHIMKRARALDKSDLIPENWKQTSLIDEETIIAGGVPGVADTPGDFRNTERLMNYWAFGKGAAKIRWGTPGDLTRAHRHLAKYVGPMRAWGLAQNLHKRVMGVSNITHDRATGQYRGRRKG